MLKNIQLFLLLLFITLLCVSQGTNLIPKTNPTLNSSRIPFPGEPCASSYLEDELLRTDPAYVQLRNVMEQQVQAYILQQKSNSSRAAGVVYTIPVVFHIMHSGETLGDSTNISFAQVQSTIAALNRDFRRTNGNGGIAQSGPLGVDAEIEFCMAQKDPIGNTTSGVTRHDMSGIQGYLDSGVYHNSSLWRHDVSMKTMVQWNPSEYMNVWVVNKIKNTGNIYTPGYSGGVIGYATFPGGTTSSDGIVILSSATGNDPTGILNYNLASYTDDGRILTHEVGHYLNLYHTFQSTSTCGTSGVSCATIGDRCCDTPPTTVGMGNNCTTPSCPLENKENYMQYQNGACASDFTADQVLRMRVILASTSGLGRNGLVTNNNCSSPISIDLRLDTIFVPIDTICSTSFTPEIVVCNNSASDSVTSFDVKYKVDGGAESTFNWTGNLQFGECDTFFLPSVTSTNGVHTYTARVDSVSINLGDFDTDPTNNYKTNSFTLSGSNVALVQMVSVCDSFVSPSGKIWKASGMNNDTLPNAFGCDSLFSFNLTVNYSDTVTINITTCDSLVSPSGKIWKTTGTYYDSSSTTFGCDSFMTFNLTISTQHITTSPEIRACDSIQINSKWYYTSQNINDTIPASYCDTIRITPLVINYTSFSISTLVFCDSLVSASGKVYRNSGFFRDTMPNAKGCDSLVEYYLTANRSTVSNRLITACGSYISPLGNVYNTSGVYSDTLSTYKGCDSIINTYLIIDTVVNITIDRTICFGDSLVLSNGTVAKGTGTYNDTVFGSISSSLIYSEDFQGTSYSFTLNTNDTNAIIPGASDNAWIINNSYTGGSVFGSTIINTPNQDVAVTGNINSTYLHIYNKRSAALSFPTITNSNYIDANIVLLGGQSGLNFSKMTNDISTVGKSHVSYEMYYLCRGSFGRLYYSLNSGTTWNRIGGKINNGGQKWSHFSLVDPVFANQPSIRFAVGFNNTDGLGVTPGFAVDEIAINAIGASSSNCDSLTTINLTLKDTTSSYQALTTCDSLISPSGKIWKNSGTYFDTIPNVGGCDSLMTINLTVSFTTYINQADTACDLFIWRLKIRSVTGLHYDTVNTGGCDTVYALNLLINNSYLINNSVISCDSFLLPNGTTIYTNGSYIDTLISSKGCDSITINNVTITTASSSIISYTHCGFYTSPSGKTFTTTGTYYDTIPTSGGCDSLITINLTILTSTSSTVLANGCDTFSLPGGTIVTATGTYRDTLINGNGCDSIIITNLILGYSSNVIQNFSLCAGETVTVGSNVYGITGIYNDTFATTLGCDSIINTNLLINPLTPGIITYTTDMCQDASLVQFTATPSGGNWGGTGINTTTGFFNPTLAGAGIYTITYTGPGPCGRKDSAIVEVYSMPTITYTLTDDECDVGDGEIDVTIIGGTPSIIYTWSTGETTEDLIGLKEGTFTLSLVDAKGCTSSETISIINVSTPDCNYNIFVPNVFSPDGNGENDVLKVEGNGIETIEFIIFNKWGNLIFKSSSADQGWDGTFKGQPVNQGAFVYFVKGTFVDGNSFEQKGTVTVIRR